MQHTQFISFKDLEENQKTLHQAKRKLEKLEVTISNNWNGKKIKKNTKDERWLTLSSDKFNESLTDFVLYFINDSKSFNNYFCYPFKASNNQTTNNIETIRLQAFANRFSTHIMLKQYDFQKKCIGEFLNCIDLVKMKAAITDIIPEENFEAFLLNRIQTDALIFPLFSNYQPCVGILQSLNTFWNICTEDISNFLKSFDKISKTPKNSQDAMAFAQLYQMQTAIVADIAKGIAIGAGGVASEGGGSLTAVAYGACISFIPFIGKAFYNIYYNYRQTTPSNSDLLPLLVFSDPNFYQGVAPVKNRNDILSQIAHLWRQQVTPILVGEPGCGKTSILIEVARRIHQGTFPEFHKNNKYKVFGGSAISLAGGASQYFGNGNIEDVFKKISDKKNYAILLLDEIQGFDDGQKTLLRGYFDGMPQSIRYAVFATTTEGAKAFFDKDDGSLARRFVIIHVPKFDLEETRSILHHQAHSLAPTLVVDPRVISRIVNHTNGEFAQSKIILLQILRKVIQKNQILASQELFNKTTNEINIALIEHQLNISRGQTQFNENTMQLIEKQKELEKKLQDETLIIQNHVLLLAHRANCMSELYGMSKKILAAFEKHLVSKEEKLDQITNDTKKSYFVNSDFEIEIKELTKEFIYYNFFLNPIICKRIKEYEEEYGLISEITNDFVKDKDLII